MALTEVSSNLVTDTVKKLYDEAVTVDMIVDGQVTVGELAEINVNGAVLDALPKAIDAWRAKVRDPKDLDPRKLTKYFSVYFS